MTPDEQIVELSKQVVYLQAQLSDAQDKLAEARLDTERLAEVAKRGFSIDWPFGFFVQVHLAGDCYGHVDVPFNASDEERLQLVRVAIDAARKREEPKCQSKS
jgi:hypothetical protein